jgi:hypothetical protein
MKPVSSRGLLSWLRRAGPRMPPPSALLPSGQLTERESAGGEPDDGCTPRRTLATTASEVGEQRAKALNAAVSSPLTKTLLSHAIAAEPGIGPDPLTSPAVIGPLDSKLNLGLVAGPVGAGPVVPRPPPTARVPAGQNTPTGPAERVAVWVLTVASEVREQIAKTRKVRGAPALL